jgi:hypothetical protein
MPPIRLSDDELSAVLAAARPLDVRVRNAFSKSPRAPRRRQR